MRATLSLFVLLAVGGCALDNRTGPALADAIAATTCRDHGVAEATLLARASARLGAALGEVQDLDAARAEWAAARAAYDRGAAVFLAVAPDLWPAVDGRLDDPLVTSGLRILEGALFGATPPPPPALAAQAAALADATTRLARAVQDPQRPLGAAALISSMAAVAGVAATKADGSDSPYAGLSHRSLAEDLAGLEALYQQALVHLQRALGAGNQSAEVHYALGQVLGKHYEQALYEARLSGGGAWAKKRLKEIAPRYLTPAIESLQRSRTMRLDAAAYLEGLIAFYQHEHEVALRHADAALREAPWLYEGAQLAGDVHHERALQARDGGRYEEAEREFAAAVKRYEQAGEIGRSDAQVHERLAECWVRRIEMAMNRGQPTEAAYERGLAAAARIMAAEPESVAGPLKQAQAASMTMLLGGTAVAKAERVQACLGAARAALLRQPGHPYASDIAAVCFSYAAYEARGRGQDPEGLLRQGITILTPVLQHHADFLWGLNDLGIQYITLGSSQWIRRDPAASASLEAAIAWFAKASRLDPGYLYAVSNTVLSYAIMAGIPTSAERTAEVLARLEGAFARCTGINDRHSECYNNYAIGCTHAALRAHLGGQDPRPRLALALENFVVRRRLAGGAQDTEQYEALARLIDARDRVRRGQDPGPALREMDAALRRCLDLVQTDAMCRTLSAQGELARADWLAQARQPVLPALQRALAKATGAVQSPEIYPDAWQALADAHLRLARARPARALGHIAAGLAATEKIFAVSPGQARGLATKGELYLLQARAGLPAEAGGRAARALEQALRADPLLVHEYAPRLAQAQALAAAP